MSNTAAMTCLDLPSMHFRILVSKLGFLVRLLKKDDDNLAGSVVLSLCDFGESCLVRECRLWDLASELGFEGCVWSANAQQSNGSPIYALFVYYCLVYSSFIYCMSFCQCFYFYLQ